MSLRDLVWRGRRLAVAVGGTALVMAMALLTSGVGAAFTAEAQRSVAALGGDQWLVPSGAPGAFNTPPVGRAGDADVVARLPGVRAADPVVIVSQSLQQHGARRFVVVVGYRPGGLASLTVVRGRARAQPYEAMVDVSLGQPLGARLAIGTRDFTIVGITSGLTSSGGFPNIYADIRDIDAAQFQGQPVANAIVVAGHVAQAPAGYKALDIPAVVNDQLLPLSQAKSTVDVLQFLFWLVAAFIVAAFIYLSTNERRRDFAVMKAIGLGSRSLGFGVVIQSTVVALSAALISAALAVALSPMFPVEVTIPPIEFVILPVGALVIGLVASLIALRRVVSLDPALAFASAA